MLSPRSDAIQLAASYRYHPPVYLADTAGDSRASSPPTRAVDSTGSETTLGEAGPDLASVGTAGEGAVGIENGIAGLNKVGVAWLTG